MSVYVFSDVGSQFDCAYFGNSHFGSSYGCPYVGCSDVCADDVWSFDYQPDGVSDSSAYDGRA